MTDQTVAQLPVAGPKPDDDPSKRTFETAPYENFRTTVNVLTETPSEICRALGYRSAGVWRRWEKDGVMPKVAAVGCQGLRARAGVQDTALIRATDLEVLDGSLKVREVYPGHYVVGG